MLGGFWADFGSIWGRFSVLGGSWEGLGWVLGGLWVALGAHRFGVGFEARRRAQNRSKIDAEMLSNVASVFGSMFNRFVMDFGVDLSIILGSCWASYRGSAT